MDFELDDEQTALRDAVRRLLATTYSSIDGRRASTAKDPGWDEGMWGRLAEMGVLGLPFSEDEGGMGAGPVEVALVAEELGRVLAPEPFAEAVVLAGGLLAAAGSDEQKARWLPGVVDGTTVAAFARFEPGAAASAAPKAVTATRSGDGWVLDGVKEPVLHGAQADVLVVSARDGDRTALFLVEADAVGLERVSYPAYDGTRVARVTFAATPAQELGAGDATGLDATGLDATGLVATATAHSTVALCHEAVGAMETALDLTTEYLKTRKQFGVPLKTFQALTFRAADMYVQLELAKSITLWATLVLLEGAPDAALAAADRAVVQTLAAGRHIGQEAIQLHGGIGMTAEYAVGHYTTRLTAIDQLLGGRVTHLQRLAAHVGEYGVVDPLEA